MPATASALLASIGRRMANGRTKVPAIGRIAVTIAKTKRSRIVAVRPRSRRPPATPIDRADGDGEDAGRGADPAEVHAVAGGGQSRCDADQRTAEEAGQSDQREAQVGGDPRLEFERDEHEQHDPGAGENHAEALARPRRLALDPVEPVGPHGNQDREDPEILQQALPGSAHNVGPREQPGQGDPGTNFMRRCPEVVAYRPVLLDVRLCFRKRGEHAVNARPGARSGCLPAPQAGGSR